MISPSVTADQLGESRATGSVTSPRLRGEVGSGACVVFRYIVLAALVRAVTPA